MINSKYIVIIALLLGAAFSACKKEEPKEIVFDYRDFFVGTYNGIETSTQNEYAGSVTTTSVTVDSNAVVTFTKDGNYPSTNIKNQNGAIYSLALDDNSHTTATNTNGDKVTLGNSKLKMSSSYWSSSHTENRYVFEGTKAQ